MYICYKMDELFVCMFSFCMNLMYVIRCRLYFISDCVFSYKLNTDCVVYPSVTDELTSAYPSLLWTHVAIDG
jgi:hypothetical protein